MSNIRKYKTYYDENNDNLPKSTRCAQRKTYEDDGDSSTDDMQLSGSDISKQETETDETNHSEIHEQSFREETEADETNHSEIHEGFRGHDVHVSADEAMITSSETCSMNNSANAEHPSSHESDGYNEITETDDYELPDSPRNEDLQEAVDFNILNDLEYDSDDFCDEYEDYEYEDFLQEQMSEEDKQIRFSKLLSMLNTGKLDDTIDATFTVSQAEVFLAILKFSSRYSLPNSGIQDLCKMINTFLSDKILPDTRYRLNNLFADNESMEYHAVCPKCDVYIKQFSRSERTVFCNVCEQHIPVKGNNANFFVFLNVKDNIKRLLEKYQVHYNFTINDRQQCENTYADIVDGLEYKKFVKSLSPNDRTSYATCIFNSDGAPIFKSSTYSIWPIQAIINELPTDVRNAESITSALWFGKNKPNMNIFLQPFLQQMNILSTVGVSCKINNENKNIKIYALCCCVDSVARAPMQGLIQFNGFYGCNWCLHPGTLVKHTTRKTVKYPLLDYIPEKRDELQTIQHMEDSITSERPVYGIKKPSVLINLSKFNIISGFVPDYMHCISLGICRQFTNYWLSSSRQPFSISKNNVKLIDKMLSSLQVPRQVARISRSIVQRNYWKAREWDNWLLFYSLPILREISNFKVYAEHWELLVEAVHLLIKETVYTADIIHADANLKKFVAFTETYYSRKAMTFNVHQLLHVSQSVIDWGPLWAHNGYGFESGNGKILKMIKASNGILHQICRSMEFEQSAFMLEEHINQKYDESRVIEFCEYLFNNYRYKSIKLSNHRYFGKGLTTDRQWIDQLQLSHDHTETYLRMVINNCIFDSCERRILKTRNCFAYTSDGSFIMIQKFIADLDNDKEYTICRKINAENYFTICKAIKRIVHIDPQLVAIKTNSIRNAVICIDINKKQYVSVVLNEQYN